MIVKLDYGRYDGEDFLGAKLVAYFATCLTYGWRNGCARGRGVGPSFCLDPGDDGPGPYDAWFLDARSWVWCWFGGVAF